MSLSGQKNPTKTPCHCQDRKNPTKTLCHCQDRKKKPQRHRVGICSLMQPSCQPMCKGLTASNTRPWGLNVLLIPINYQQATISVNLLTTHRFLLFTKCGTSEICTQQVTELELHPFQIWVQQLCESQGGCPGLSVLMSLMVSMDVKQYWTVLWHWSQFVPNMST